MVCKNCGKVTSDNEACCQNCGFAVLPEAEGLPVSAPQKKKRAVLRVIAVFVAAGIIIAGYFGVRYYLHNMEVDSAAAELQKAISQAEELSVTVEEMYTSTGGGEIRGDLTHKEIKDARARLENIQAEPNEEYAGEVAERLDAAGHKELLERLDARLLEAAEKRDSMDMQVFVDAGQELSQKVEELFTEPGGDFIKPRLTDSEIRPLKKELSEIQRDPEGEYAQAVNNSLNISAHHKLLDNIEKRLEEAEEKRLAKAEVNGLFEVTAIIAEGYPDNLPLKPETDEAVLAEITEKYSSKEIFDSFWFTVNTVLENAKYELLWIEDAKLAVEKLEALESMTEEQYGRAMDEVDYLQDGTIKTGLKDRLEALKKRQDSGEAVKKEPRLQAYLDENPDMINISKMDEIFDDMAEAKLKIEGDILTIEVCYMPEWDGMMELIIEGLDDDLSEIDQVYIQRAAEIRKTIPDFKLVLEIQKSTGEAVWSRTY